MVWVKVGSPSSRSQLIHVGPSWALYRHGMDSGRMAIGEGGNPMVIIYGITARLA
jgi:hypothetical protein